MNQAEILKRLLTDYRTAGGDTADLKAATDYLNAHKPAGTGRVNVVICGALTRQLASKPKLDIPPAPVQHIQPSRPHRTLKAEPVPIIIASKTVTFPEVMRDKPQAVYHEMAATPTAPAPAPNKSTPEQKPTSFLERLKFWKWKR